MKLLRVAGAAVLMTALLAVATPASANDGGTWNIKIAPGTVSQTFDAMAVNDASGNFNADPETCVSLPWCTVVILHPTDFPQQWDPETNQYIWRTVLSWDDHPVVSRDQGAGGGVTQSANDLDEYAYKKVVTTDDAGEESTSYEVVNQSAGSNQPEVMKLFGPQATDSDIYLVIYNSVGPNLGFKVDITFKDTSIEPLPEFGSPRPSGGGSSSGSSASEPFDAPTAPFNPKTHTPSTPSALPLSEPSLAPVTSVGVTSGADDFNVALPSDKSFLGTIGAKNGSTVDLLANSRRTLGPPKSVPGLLLFFWLGVVPAVFSGAAIAWLIRRRPTALTLAVNPA